MAPGLRAIHPEDLDRVHELMRRIETHDRIPFATPRGELSEWLEEPHFDLATDSRLVEADDGEVIAWGRIWHPPHGEREERAYAFGGVDPARRKNGVGSALLAWQIERATALLREASHTLPRYLRTHAYEFQDSALRLYPRHGLLPVRYTDELIRQLDTVPPPETLPGIEIVRWDPERAEEARLAENEAFLDHWGTTPRDRATWEHLLDSSGSRTDLSFLGLDALDALDGKRVVGVCRNGHFPEDEAVSGRRDGWIMNLSVVRSHRKRGIASALIIASENAFKAAGLTHSALGVDTANVTGAHHLYERLGYRRMNRFVVSQLEVFAGGPSSARH